MGVSLSVLQVKKAEKDQATVNSTEAAIMAKMKELEKKMGSEQAAAAATGVRLLGTCSGQPAVRFRGT